MADHNEEHVSSEDPVRSGLGSLLLAIHFE